MQYQVTSGRVLLRPFVLADAPAIEQYVGDWEVARTTRLIPHPYPKGGAAEWLGQHAAAIAGRRNYPFAIVLRETNELIGAIDLRVLPERTATLGYWIARPHWGKGYATEALRGLLAFAFRELRMRRVWAIHLCENPASGAVMRKNGMRRTGRLHGWHRDWPEKVAFDRYGIRVEEWAEHSGHTS